MKSPRLLPILLAIAIVSTPSVQAADHPLDPLSDDEVWQTLVLLRDAGHIDRNAKFSQLTLEEPAKRQVLAWRPGEPMPRRAYALVRKDDEAFEAVVDLAAEEVVSWARLEGAEPNWHSDEYDSMTDKVLEHPDFLAGLAARGVTDLTFVDCRAGLRGYFGTEQEEGRRIAHVRCSEPDRVKQHEIEDLIAVVDLESEEILRIIDEDAGRIPAVETDFRNMLGEEREIAGPIEIRQPLGCGFELKGYQVSWQNWSFHLRPDQRTGLVLSLVTYRENPEAAPRSILYQGYLSEIFVPYMDPSYAWYRNNFIDVGEYVAVGLGKPLLPGDDCPDHAAYIDATNTDANGYPSTVPGTICIYERETGDPSWRHWSSEGAESRKSRDLVIRLGGVVGNYDYLMDWIFRQNGSIEVRVGSTGILAYETTAAASALSPAPATGPTNATAADAPVASGDADAYGRFVQPNVVAVNHDHYFSFRLDLDVDGADNRFVADRLVARRLPADHPRRSLWVQEPQDRVERARCPAPHRLRPARPVAGAERQPHQRCRLPDQLPGGSGPQCEHAALRRRLSAPPRRLHRPPPVGDAPPRRRALRRRRPPHPERAWPRADRVDGGRPVDQGHRHRPLAHRGHAPPAARRGLAGHAHALAQL